MTDSPSISKPQPVHTTRTRWWPPPSWVPWLFAILCEGVAFLAAVESVTPTGAPCYLRALCLPEMIAAENRSERLAGIAIVFSAAALLLAYTAGRTTRSTAAA